MKLAGVQIGIEERVVSGRGIPFGPRRIFIVSERHDDGLMLWSEWRVYSRRVAEKIAWERQEFWRLSYRQMVEDLKQGA